ncbi:unnamed protein product [Peronospora belbahrii]|uniref:Uncharacterized protein n=1 Tax=Peronospora belbahrii TaxID=622444 RepID=A0AAU9KGX6_9STRA|nr:unnamed protein product [Peronospora belbahrii]CAH0516279.1 unnamed protein product [Peronospora belbahrii]
MTGILTLLIRHIVKKPVHRKLKNPSLVRSAYSLDLRPDQVVPFPEVLPEDDIFKLGLRIKLQLHISSGCHPYPAVNRYGFTAYGLSDFKVFTSCKGSPLGSQVYGREVTIGAIAGIILSSDTRIRSVTVQTLAATKKSGEYQDLIMWSNMTDAARKALEQTSFMGAMAPVSTKKFKRSILKAYDS